jgi:hypothetical protein
MLSEELKLEVKTLASKIANKVGSTPIFTIEELTEEYEQQILDNQVNDGILPYLKSYTRYSILVIELEALINKIHGGI